MYGDANRLRGLDHSMDSVKGVCDEVHQRVLDKVHYLDLELRAVSIGLKTKLEESQVYREQMLACFDYLPIGAILLNQNGQIERVNHAAKGVCGPECHFKEGQFIAQAWRDVGWPPVPFTNFIYQGREMNSWEEVLGKPGTVPCLTVRFIAGDRVSPLETQNPQEPRLRVLGERVAKTSHDLRNALASIELFASLLHRQSSQEAEKNKVGDHLLRSIRSLEHFVNNLLAYARPRDTRSEDIHVHALFDQVELLLTQPAQDRQVCIKRIVAPEVEVVEGDKGLLQQACLNVLANAIAASPSGGVIEIHCRREESSMTAVSERDECGAVSISVRDHGCGINEKDLAQVCHAFYSTRNGGTGLGLSIVKDVMDAHHGTVDVQSREGLGTTVSLRFPQQRRSA